MSAQIPAICSHRVSDAAKKTLDVVAKFVEEECIPYALPYCDCYYFD